MMKLLSVEEFLVLNRSERAVLDVRAPIEFAQGHIVDSFNVPVLEDEERKQVGTTYKRDGPQQAIALGYSLVQGGVREQRMRAWLQWTREHPLGLLTCFRGGLRSQTVQGWLKEAGVQIPRLSGGYKAYRNWSSRYLQEKSFFPRIGVISGNTGSGKTQLLQSLNHSLDLESFAGHRGSAFGGHFAEKVAQANFENKLAEALWQYRDFSGVEGVRTALCFVEDESRTIGSCVIPQEFFVHMRAAPVVLVKESLEARRELILQEYVVTRGLHRMPFEEPLQKNAEILFERYQDSIRRLSRKLGDAKTRELLKYLQTAFQIWQSGRDAEEWHRLWIQDLLKFYYDPLYEKSFQKRNPELLFQGTRREVLDFLRSCSDAY